jgi:cell division protein FtsL
VSNALLIIILIVALMASGLGIVYTKHRSRELFIELQALQQHRDDMEIEWEQLQLEQSTLATVVAVDHAARTRLNMLIPDPNAVVYIKR